MSTEQLTPEKKAALALKTKIAHHEMLVRLGDVTGADKYAAKHGLPVDSATNPTVNGWLTHAEGTLVAPCINPRLSVVRLDHNGKEASVWNGPRGYAIGARVKVKLMSADGDPIYEILGVADPLPVQGVI